MKSMENIKQLILAFDSLFFFPSLSSFTLNFTKRVYPFLVLFLLILLLLLLAGKQ